MIGLMIWLAGFCVCLARVETELLENRDGAADRWWGLPLWIRGFCVGLMFLSWPAVVLQGWVEGEAE